MTRAAHRFHVCIVGGGTTGLACALAAARAGAHVELHEASAERPSLPVYVHVAPNLMRDLVWLGLGSRVAAEGFPYRRMVVRDLAGRACFDVSWASLAGAGQPAAAGIACDVLLRLLEDAAVEAGAQVRRGSRAVRVEADGARTAVAFEDERVARPDLVVLATGADCPLRDRLFPAASASEVPPQHWLHALLRRPAGLDEMSLTLAPGDGPRLVLAPVDGRRAGIAVARQRADAAIADASALKAWLERGTSWTRAIAACLDERAPVAARPIRSALVAGDWHRAGVLLAGDCAHVLPPQFGQSVAQGVEDAIVVGHLVHAARTVAPASLAALYTARRRPRAERVHGLVDLAARWDLAPGPDTDLAALARELFDAVALPP